MSLSEDCSFSVKLLGLILLAWISWSFFIWMMDPSLLISESPPIFRVLGDSLLASRYSMFELAFTSCRTCYLRVSFSLDRSALWPSSTAICMLSSSMEAFGLTAQPSPEVESTSSSEGL